MRPDCGSKKRSRSWNTVVLPAPEGPTSATVSPGLMSSEKSFSAEMPGRIGYSNVTFSKRTAPRAGVGKRHGLGRRFDLRLGREQLHQAFGGAGGLLDFAPHFRERAQARGDQHGVENELAELAGRSSCPASTA